MTIPRSNEFNFLPDILPDYPHTGHENHASSPSLEAQAFGTFHLYGSQSRKHLRLGQESE